MELVDVPDSKSSAEMRVGSSPTLGIPMKNTFSNFYKKGFDI